VDPQSRNYIFESVQRLNRERGMTIIYTSHYMEKVEYHPALAGHSREQSGERIFAPDR